MLQKQLKMTARYASVACLFSFFLNPLALVAGATVADTTTRFARVEQPLHKAYAQQESPKPQAATADQKKPTNAELVALKTPSREQQTHILLDLGKELKAPSSGFPTVIDTAFIKKMELFADAGSNNALDIINCSVTNAGVIALSNRLANPIFDVPALKQRQAIVKALLENPKLFETITACLQTMAEAEPYLLSYFEPEDELTQKFFEQIYFGKRLEKLNTSPFAMECITRLGNFGNLFNFFKVPALYAAVTIPLTYFSRLVAKKAILPHLEQAIKEGAYVEPELMALLRKPLSLKTIGSDTAKTLKHQANLLYNPCRKAYANRPDKKEWLATKDGMFGNSKTFGDVLYFVRNHEGLDNNKNLKPILIGGLVCAGIGIAGYQIYHSIKAIKNAMLQKDIINHIHTKMLAVARYTRALHKLCTIIEQHPALAQLNELQPIVELIRGSQGELKKLLELLNSSTFDGKEATIISLSGRVLAAQKLLQQVKNDLVPAIFAAGELDAFASIVHLIQKSAQQHVSYCFPEFIEKANRPYILIQDFWNPFVGADKAIANTMEFGTAAHPNNGILTGPNTGGKTTTIKGILINLLMAQTLGIAPAKKLLFTPFALLNCYLNITDDLGAGVSLFKAEVLRAKALLEGIRSLKKNCFSFTLMDEIFSGTSPQEGEQGALQFAVNMSDFANSISILATHYPRLTSLETDLAQLSGKPLAATVGFKNYKVSVYHNEDGSWHRPFKVEEGISDINIAMDLLKEEGVL